MHFTVVRFTMFITKLQLREFKTEIIYTRCKQRTLQLTELTNIYVCSILQTPASRARLTGASRSL